MLPNAPAAAAVIGGGVHHHSGVLVTRHVLKTDDAVAPADTFHIECFVSYNPNSNCSVLSRHEGL